MILNNEAERCRQAYQKHFEETLKSSNSLEEAADSCAHHYLDGKPAKKGYTNQVRSSALWQCPFWRTLPDALYSSDVVAFALGRSLHNGLEDTTLFIDLLNKAPETLKRGVRYSQIFLKPDSSPWKQILSLPNNGNKDFLDFLTVCHRLHAELCASDKAVAGLQRQLDDLTIFEYLLYASLFTYGFQLPWLMASQNNSTAAINNLRRIGCRRKGRKDETDRIESRLGDLLRSKGFAVMHSYQPDLVNGKDPGEVDLLCYMDNHLLVLEVKSTYIRKTKQDAWIHRTKTLRKASQQLSRKENAIAHAIEHDTDLQSKLKLPDQKEAIQIHSWIVDTSIEHDQELIDGYLKVSLEGLLVILNNERELLKGNLLMEEELPEDDMFPGGFSAQRFIEIVENGELWLVLKGELE